MLNRPLTLVASVVLSLSAAFTHAAEVLRVSAIPDEAPTALLRKFKPLGAYLELQLGMPVKFVPGADYAAGVESRASDRIDLAWLGGFTFVQLHLKDAEARPLVQREQDRVFTSKFVTADPKVQSLADLKGKTFAFGSISSTSGSLMPRYFMQLVGVVQPHQLARWRRQTILGVVVLAAAITPSGDPFTLAALSVPMYLFYEISLLIGRLVVRRRAQRTEDEGAAV